MTKMTPLPGIDWSEHEREQVSRLEALCRNAPHLELECSRTDAGDPWCVIYDREHHRTVLHIARIPMMPEDAEEANGHGPRQAVQIGAASFDDLEGAH
jgi:hypothetical protein